jgi:hypothetical protein
MPGFGLLSCPIDVSFLLSNLETIVLELVDSGNHHHSTAPGSAAPAACGEIERLQCGICRQVLEDPEQIFDVLPLGLPPLEEVAF